MQVKITSVLKLLPTLIRDISRWFATVASRVDVNRVTVFTRISAAPLIKFFPPQMLLLFEDSRDKEIFSSNLTVYFLSVSVFW